MERQFGSFGGAIGRAASLSPAGWSSVPLNSSRRSAKGGMRSPASFSRSISIAPRLQTARLRISHLAEHYRRRELAPDNTWKSYSTKKGYENYLKRWIVPKWGEFALCKIKPIEVELWLRQLPLAPSPCAKIKNIIRVLFNHACRYELFDRNPIHLFRH